MLAKNILGVIAARGGSKRIPRKNIVKIAGKPLIYYTIKAAKESRCLTCLILSSDDEEIIQYAKGQGVKVPFVRPKKLATENASSSEVVIHALNFMEKNTHTNYEYVCLLEPTSPLRRSIDIDTAIKKLLKSNFDSLISLIPASCRTPYRIRYVENGEVKLAFEDKFYDFIKNKSQYPQAYIPGGGIFCSKVVTLKRERKLTSGRAMPYVMKPYWGIDINEIDDLILAECLLREKSFLNGK